MSYNISLLVLMLCVLDSVSCDYKRIRSGLAEVPDDIPDDIDQIDLSENQITALRNTSFVNLTECNSMIINRNNIKHIDIGTFRYMKHLGDLQLYVNQLIEITQGMFEGLGSLRLLNLQTNQISVIGSRTFYGLNSLIYLALDVNHLTELREDMFEGLTSLKRLGVFHNRLQTLSSKVFDIFLRPLELLASDP